MPVISLKAPMLIGPGNESLGPIKRFVPAVVWLVLMDHLKWFALRTVGGRFSKVLITVVM
jgi:hypothetical protein